MDTWEAAAAPLEAGEPPGDDGVRVEARRGEEGELRRALGLESAYGFHIESDMARGGARRGDLPVAAPEAAWGRAYPCLDGYRYTGCVGAACPLERCWTGGATISYAQATRERSRVSTALYLPGAPCHSCAVVQEEDVAVPAPRAHGQPPAPGRRYRRERTALPGPVVTGQGARAAYGQSARALEGRGARALEGQGARALEGRGKQAAGPGGTVPGEASGGDGCQAEMATLRRVSCGRGLWAHPISLSSFVTKRIPMLHEAEPELCPGYAPREAPHPDVAAHLERRRETARQQRAERREREHEG